MDVIVQNSVTFYSSCKVAAVVSMASDQHSTKCKKADAIGLSLIH